MNVTKFVDDINNLLKINNIYYETKSEIRFDCRINRQLKFDKRMLDELKILGVLVAPKERYTKVQRFKNKTYRWITINKEKFRSLERLILRS